MQKPNARILAQRKSISDPQHDSPKIDFPIFGYHFKTPKQRAARFDANPKEEQECYVNFAVLFMSEEIMYTAAMPVELGLRYYPAEGLPKMEQNSASK